MPLVISHSSVLNLCRLIKIVLLMTLIVTQVQINVCSLSSTMYDFTYTQSTMTTLSISLVPISHRKTCRLIFIGRTLKTSIKIGHKAYVFDVLVGDVSSTDLSCNLIVMLRRISIVAMLSIIIGCGTTAQITETTKPTTVTVIITTPPTTIAPTTTTTTEPIDYQQFAVMMATTDISYIEAQRVLHGNCGEWYDLAMMIGWSDNDWDQMLGRVLYRESRCDPTAWNGHDAGLTQINQIHTRWIEDNGWTHPGSMFDPVLNLRFALMLYQSSGCRPWRYLTC